MKNAELAYKTLDYIKAHPEEWDQTMWHCGTTHCFAGHIELSITGKSQPDGLLTWDIAEEALGINIAESVQLFGESNTLADLEKIIKTIFGSRPEPVCN